MIDSFLDTDLYKLTMQATVLKHFPDANVEYYLTNRTGDKRLNHAAVDWLRAQILDLAKLRFTSEEIEYLRATLPFLPAAYLDSLPEFKLDPANEVTVTFDEDTQDLTVHVQGLWKTTIIYEIPLLALVSESYFKFVETDWSMEGQPQAAKRKAIALLEAGCNFSEFGTRRRRSKDTQRIVVQSLIEAAGENTSLPGKLLGTSNVALAKRFGLRPIGTVAHEFMMGVAAYYDDFKLANKRSMDIWLDTVGEAAAGFALTDTFGTPNFLEYLVKPYSDIYWGVRQDSGDPVQYTKLIAAHYEKLGYPRFAKKIIYSDSLNIELCKEYKAAAEEAGLEPSFGVGTFFTNDFALTSDPTVPSKPLNIVMKLYSVNGRPCVKLSDTASKHMGPPDVVARAKKEVGYQDSSLIIDEASRW